MSISAVCPTCGSKERLVDRMAGRRVRCAGCGKPYRVRVPTAVATPAADADVAEELRKLRLLIKRVEIARIAWNTALLLIGTAAFFWMYHHAQGLVQQQAGQIPELKKLQDLFDARP
jgi:hypothetical protein